MAENTVYDEVKCVTNVVPEKELVKAQRRALNIFADAVGKSYGPMGGYTAYSRYMEGNNKAITSNYTKDGFTILKNVDVDKPIEHLLREEIRDICTRVIKVVGDGTTSAVILSSLIFDKLIQMKEKGFPKRRIIKVFKRVVKEAIEKIRAQGHEATIEDIYNIALISLNGNEEQAKMIKDIYEKNGMNVFIDVATSNNVETITKTYSGLSYESGFISPAFINNTKDQSSELDDVHVYVFESPIDTPEMVNLFRLIILEEIEKPGMQALKDKSQGKQISTYPASTVIICPHISRDANSYIDQLINSFSQMTPETRWPLCVITNISNDNEYLHDIRALTDAKFIKKYIDPGQIEEDKKNGLYPTPKNIKTFAGHAQKVVADAISTRIINPKMMYKEGSEEYTEFFKNYLDQLENLLAKYQETREELVKIGQLKRRINILKGNMVDLFVGGIGISDRDSLRDSVEDAVLNCRSAAKDGVGFGANFEGIRVFNTMTKLVEEKSKSIEEQKKRIIDKIDIVDKEKENYKPEEYAEKLSKLKTELLELKNTFMTYAIEKSVLSAILDSYRILISKIYLPYCDDDEVRANQYIAASLANADETKRVPFNILTEEFDGKVLSSIETEPCMLDAISKIITLLFDTNQFLVPTAQFNIYTMVTDSGHSVKEEVVVKEEKHEDSSGESTEGPSETKPIEEKQDFEVVMDPVPKEV